MKNTSLMAEFRYRHIKMLLIHHSTSIIKRGQHFIPHFTTISTRGHYQYPRRTLKDKWLSWVELCSCVLYAQAQATISAVHGNNIKRGNWLGNLLYMEHLQGRGEGAVQGKFDLQRGKFLQNQRRSPNN